MERVFRRGRTPMSIVEFCPPLHIREHKRFAVRAHPNFCFPKTSSMLETLYGIPPASKRNRTGLEIFKYFRERRKNLASDKPGERLGGEKGKSLPSKLFGHYIEWTKGEILFCRINIIFQLFYPVNPVGFIIVGSI